jgi:hypothetical protein
VLKLILVLLVSLLSVQISYAEERPDDCIENDLRPQCLFTIDDDGKVHTDDGKAERTFSFPALKTGFILDMRAPNLLPFISMELAATEILGESFAIDIGGTAGLAFVSLNYELVPIMKLGPTVWGGWNVPEKEYTFGVGFTIIKF